MEYILQLRPADNLFYLNKGKFIPKLFGTLSELEIKMFNRKLIAATYVLLLVSMTSMNTFAASLEVFDRDRKVLHRSAVVSADLDSLGVTLRGEGNKMSCYIEPEFLKAINASGLAIANAINAGDFKYVLECVGWHDPNTNFFRVFKIRAE